MELGVLPRPSLLLQRPLLPPAPREHKCLWHSAVPLPARLTGDQDWTLRLRALTEAQDRYAEQRAPMALLLSGQRKAKQQLPFI